MNSKLTNPKNFNVELTKEDENTYMQITCYSDVFDSGNNIMRHPKTTFCKVNLNDLELVKKDDKAFIQFELPHDEKENYVVQFNMLDCYDESKETIKNIEYQVCRDVLRNDKIICETYPCNSLEEAIRLKEQIQRRNDDEQQEALLNAKNNLTKEEFDKEINSEEYKFYSKSKYYIQKVTSITTTYETVE